jgi:hypothetical protein
VHLTIVRVHEIVDTPFAVGVLVEFIERGSHWVCQVLGLRGIGWRMAEKVDPSLIVLAGCKMQPRGGFAQISFDIFPLSRSTRIRCWKIFCPLKALIRVKTLARRTVKPIPFVRYHGCPLSKWKT